MVVLSPCLFSMNKECTMHFKLQRKSKMVDHILVQSGRNPLFFILCRANIGLFTNQGIRGHILLVRDRDGQKEFESGAFEPTLLSTQPRGQIGSM